MDSDGGFGGFPLSDCEPKDWFAVFHENTSKWWIRWLARGRFKHVSVFGVVPRSNAWIFYEFSLDRARVYVVPDYDSGPVIGNFVGSGTVVRMARPIGRETEMNLRPGGWCVPAVAHILGIRGSALRPDTLFRQCLAQGGEIVVKPKGDEDEGREAQA
ncbi:hypothetical protein SM0020_12265 [Sinorhizobium meliloti CCNWSX0020]|uniref:Uncharacterized protein n=1 Tax=Sinorhizobium meliloti CCNWSX0020 TaxID=1107881 RepID=H0FZ19_RHIML|nr:hypothetical protein [Sinorhizobium meliloti]EHK77699.1 hypothetical protein SM0020_12265 [Sinorhizobium meliloti CCNWSX0020]